MTISSPELTALDLVRYVRAAGGLDAVATILVDLGEKIDGVKLTALAPQFERAVVQRLGYLIERVGHADAARGLHDYLSTRSGSVRWVSLEPQKRGRGSAAAVPIERNERWHVAVQRYPEIDE